MKIKVHSEDKIILAVNSFLQEFKLSSIDTPSKIMTSLFTETILFGALKSTINRMIKKSKVDNDLTREISSVTSKRFSVRILPDNRIFSFEDGDGTIWLSQGLISLLSREEVVAVMLHEIGHGKEKLKILYDHLTMNPKNPKKLKFLTTILGNLLKSRGVETNPRMMTRVYMLSYIIYTSLIENPFKGLYKWSYSDLTIQYGYWDEYEIALYKINRYIVQQEKSKIALKIQKIEEESPGTVDQLKRDLGNSAGDSSDNLERQIKNLSVGQNTKPDKSIIRRILRTIF